LLQRLECRPRTDRNGQIPGNMVLDTFEARRFQVRVETARRVPELESGSASDRNDHHVFLVAKSKCARAGLIVVGLEHERRREAINERVARVVGRRRARTDFAEKIFQIHVPGAAATLARLTASPQPDDVGKSFPGLQSPRGFHTSRTACIKLKSASENRRPM